MLQIYWGLKVNVLEKALSRLVHYLNKNMMGFHQIFNIDEFVVQM